MVKRLFPMASSSDAGSSSVSLFLLLSLIHYKKTYSGEPSAARSQHGHSTKSASIIHALISTDDEPSTYAAGWFSRHCRDPGREVWRACSAGPARRGHRRLFGSYRQWLFHAMDVDSDAWPRPEADTTAGVDLHQLIIHMTRFTERES